MIAKVKAILSGWDNVRVEDHGAYWLVAGSYQGQAHAGTREDPISLAHDLVALAMLAPVSAYEKHWETMTSGTLAEAAAAPVFVDPLVAENDALRARIAELEAAPVLELSNDPPTEALMEAYPDEDHAALKARILAEFASLRNALVGHIPMTMEQLARLQALEHPKFQTWLQA
jgi:hypothetical protein